MLSLLLVDAGQVVPTDHLIDEVWGETPPDGARKTVQAHMSHLRRVLNVGGEVLVSADGGYRLVVDTAMIDSARFERELAVARQLSLEDSRMAADRFREALDLFRGVPLAGLADDAQSLRLEAARLGELRLEATEELLEARLSAGEDAVLVPEIERLVAQHPLRERLWVLLMSALYRAGRQSEALRAFSRVRVVLAEELGIEPSGELKSLEQRILDQDPGLASGPVALSRPSQVDSVIRNPYKGLRPFEESDASDFFGRDDLVRRMLERLGDRRRGQGLLVLAGPSGAGKSSAIRAGLIPALRRSGQRVAIAFPGRSPFAAIANAIADLDNVDPREVQKLLEDGEPLAAPTTYVVLDQAEELFTFENESGETELFLDRIAHDEEKLRWILTIRADSLDRLISHPGLGSIIGDSVILVPPLQDHEVAAAVAKPSERVGVAVDPDLVAEIVHEVRTQPTALPLLQFSLTDTFERRRGEKLTLAEFENAGGIAGAVSRRADEVYDRFDDGEKAAARQLLLQLVTLSDDGTGVRRRVERQAVESLLGDPDVMERVIEQLASQRLLTFDQDPTTGEATVEVAHEALISEWPRLAIWVGEAGDDLRMRRRLASAVGDWEASGREESFALRGSRLTEMEIWAEGSRLAVDGEARALLEESRRIEDTFRTRQQKKRRAVVATLSVASLVVAVSAVVAFAQRNDAREAAQIATVRELALASESNLTTDPELSLLLALEAVGQAGEATVPEAANALHNALLSNRLLASIDFNGQGIARYSPDGNSFLSSGEDPAIPVVWDVETMATRFSLEGHTAPVTDGVYSKDGRRLATSGDDGTVRIWDAATGDSEMVLETGVAMTMPAFSPDGTLVASGSYDGPVWVWNLASGELLWKSSPPAGTHVSWNPEFSPDGTLLAVGAVGDLAQQGAQVWDLATAEVEVIGPGHTEEVRDVAFTPDGASLVTGSFDGTVRVWEVATWENIRTFYGHDTAVYDVVISTDGARVASTSTNSALVWDFESGEVLVSLAGQGGIVDGMDISPEGTRLITASTDNGTLRVWDITPLASHELFAFPTPGFNGEVGFRGEVAFSADGRTMASTSDRSGGIDLWSFPEGELVGGLDVPTDNVALIAFAPDGTSVVIGSTGGVWFIDLLTQELTLLDPSVAYTIAYSPNGMLAFGTEEGLWLIRDPPEGVKEQLRSDWISALAFDPHERFLAFAGSPGSGGEEGDVELIDLDALDSVGTGVGHESEVRAVDFSPDGAWFATASVDGTAIVWDTETLKIRQRSRDTSERFTT